MPDAWFVERKQFICQTANNLYRDDNPAYHFLSANEKDMLYDGLVEAYKEAAETETMYVAIKTLCCGGACGGILYQRELFAVMRNQARRTIQERPCKDGRAWFLEFPVEILGEIRRYLTTTDFINWRRADRWIALSRLPPPEPSHDWKAIMLRRHPGILHDSLAILVRLAQIIYDDDLPVFVYQWEAPLNDPVVRGVKTTPGFWHEDHLQQHGYAAGLEEVIAMAGATRIYTFLVNIKAIRDHSKTRDAYMVDTAARYARMDFIYNTLKWRKDALLARLYNWKIRDGGDNRLDHPVVQMVKHGHYAQVKCFVDYWMAHGTPLPDMILRACCAYGDLDTLSQFKDKCSRDMIRFTLKEGTVATGLIWLQTHRPDLFVGKKAVGKHVRYIVAVALRQAAVPILNWLVEFNYLKLASDAYMLRVLAIKRGQTRALDWLMAVKALDIERDGQDVYDHTTKCGQLGVLRWLKDKYKKRVPEDKWPGWVLL